MINKILHILGIIALSIIGFWSGFQLSDALSKIDKNSQKAQVIELVAKEPENEFTENSLSDEDLQENKIPQENEIEIKEKVVKNKEPFKCPEPTKEYEDMSLLNLDQENNLPDTSYIPKNLEEIESTYSTKNNICLIKEARDNFELMIKKANEDGYIIKASSGFRNYEYQKKLLSNAIKIGNPNAEIAIAKAGHSEHQLGTAVDVTGQSINYDSASKKFEKTNEAKWMESNASNYGFILSYGEGKEDITGYMYEPWHYRYVGVDLAKEIIESDKTLNEYLRN